VRRVRSGISAALLLEIIFGININNTIYQIVVTVSDKTV